MSASSEPPTFIVSGSHGLRKVSAEAILLLVATLLAALGTHLLHPRAPQWYVKDEPLAKDEVTLNIIQQKWHDDVLWIDARPRQAYTAAHIPEALLLNEQEADALMFDHIEKLQNNTRPIIVYCDGHACQASRKMAEYLRERLPSSEIYVLRGGWKAWADAQKGR